MMLQLDPPIPMYTPKGFGYALFLNYPSVELGCWWCVGISDTRELWWTPNEEVRLEKNISLWRRGGPGENEILPVPMETQIPERFTRPGPPPMPDGSPTP